jgi:drug/metabolite transporter (DMT)-like permease
MARVYPLTPGANASDRVPAVTLGLFLNLLLLAVLWGSAFPGIKVGLEGLSAPHLTLLRFAVASLCFAPYLMLKRRRLLPEREDLPYFFLLGLLGITVYHLALNFGQAQVTAGAASLIIATAPAITAVVAYFLIGDRLPVLGWLGIFVSFAGVSLIVMGDNPELGFNPWALLILVSAVTTAFYAVLQKRMFARYSAVQVTAFSTWAGTLPLLVFLPGLPADLADAGLAPLLWTVYIGVFPAAFAYAQFSYAISVAPVTLVAAYLYMVPVFSLLFAWLVLGELPTPLTLLGGAVAIVGIVLVNHAKRRSRERSPALVAAEKGT